jgi:hypothetical protein
MKTLYQKQKAEGTLKRKLNGNEISRRWYKKHYKEWYKKNKDRVAKSITRYQRANPEKTQASRAVRNAVSRNNLVRLPCEVCGNPKTHGHHEDYAKQLEVRWLCPLHHAQRHVIIKKERDLKQSIIK